MIHDRTPTENFGKFAYSNTGYYLLGMIVEAATGSTVSDEIEHRVFSPLMLTRTRLTRQGLLDAPRSHSYTMIPPVVNTSSINATLIGHTGENPGTATMWYYFPDYRTTIFVAVNRNDARTGPDQAVKVDGLATASDIFMKTWKILWGS